MAAVCVCIFICLCVRISCSCGGKINHYLVAMDFTSKKLTINGEEYFDNLLELVQVSVSHGRSHEDHMTIVQCAQVYSEKPGPLECVLSHPLTRRGILDFCIDQDALKKSEFVLLVLITCQSAPLQGVAK